MAEGGLRSVWDGPDLVKPKKQRRLRPDDDGANLEEPGRAVGTVLHNRAWSQHWKIHWSTLRISGDPLCWLAAGALTFLWGLTGSAKPGIHDDVR
jgi:hypothetical protein